MKKRMMLYFGSFNPIHRGHVSLAEYLLDGALCDEVALVVSPHNPLKQVEGLAPEFERFTMAEMAAAESKYPERIKASVIEFLLEKPSYTINTLNYLEENHGADMEFSLLIGEDNLELFDRWRSYEEILERFKVYVYPREGAHATKLLDKVVMLSSAPLHNLSSTTIREALESGESVADMLTPSVEQHIRKSGVWRPKGELAKLNAKVTYSQSEEELTAALLKRGKWYHHHSEWGKALNDLNRVVEIEPTCHEAEQLTTMINEILNYRYKDIYNL